MDNYEKQMSRQERMMSQLQESQKNMLSELKNQRSRQKKLIDRIRGDNDTISRMRGNRTLMLNDGNISLPVYDYLHYEKVFDDFDRQRRMETLEILNRFGESIVKFIPLNHQKAKIRLRSELLR